MVSKTNMKEKLIYNVRLKYFRTHLTKMIFERFILIDLTIDINELNNIS